MILDLSSASIYYNLLFKSKICFLGNTMHSHCWEHYAKSASSAYGWWSQWNYKKGMFLNI